MLPSYKQMGAAANALTTRVCSGLVSVRVLLHLKISRRRERLRNANVRAGTVDDTPDVQPPTSF